MRGLPIALAFAVAMAGCSAGPSPPSGDAPGDVGPSASSIEGVVVSPAIVPMPGVALRLEPAGLDAVSDDAGLFSFHGLREGSYTLEASRDGYVATTLPVEAGGPLLKVILEPDPQVGTYVESYVFDGFVDYSVNLFVGRTSGASAPNFTFGQRMPELIQMELVWESTQSFGERLDLTAIAETGNVTRPAAGHAEGPSPLLLAINSTAIAEYHLGPEVPLTMAVFAGQEPVAEGRGYGVVVSQSYRLVTHMFYGSLPPVGWRFTADGEPPGPA